MQVLIANIRAFNSCRIIKIMQFVFLILYLDMYFVFTGIVRTVHKTKSTIFISLLDMHIFNQYSLPMVDK